MAFLEGVLAFSVVMIALATIVSGLVEIVARSIGLRAKVLKAMIEQFILDDLAPRLKREGSEILLEAQKPLDTAQPRASDPLGRLWGWIVRQFRRVFAAADKRLEDESVRSLIDDLTRNPTRPKKNGRVRDGDRIERLSTFAMLQRLAKTEAGAALYDAAVAHGETALAAMLDDLTRTYERYVASAREIFRRRANAVAVVVAIALAFAANINAPAIFAHLIANPAAREALIEKGEETNAAYRAAEDQLLAALAALGETEADADAAAEALQDARAGLRASLQRVDDLAGENDLPIGWDAEHTPCFFSAEEDCPKGTVDGCVEAAVIWVLGVLLGGLLIGLGGPFWYRVFDGLSKATRTLKSVTGRNPELVAPPNSDQGSVVTPSSDADLLTAFRQARAQVGTWKKNPR